MTQALEARIDQLESRFQFRDLVSDYCHGFDKRDLDQFMAICEKAAAIHGNSFTYTLIKSSDIS